MAAHDFFQFSDDGERIYLLRATYTDPEARGYRLPTMEWMFCLHAPVFHFRWRCCEWYPLEQVELLQDSREVSRNSPFSMGACCTMEVLAFQSRSRSSCCLQYEIPAFV